MKPYSLILFSLLALPLSGCLSPSYEKPSLPAPAPAEYKNLGEWVQVNPKSVLQRTSWWTLFQDDGLTRLMQDLNSANQNIAVAAANFRKARAETNAARAGFVPTVDGTGSITRSSTDVTGTSVISESYKFGGNVQWEASLWNTINAYESASATESASAADYAAMKLAMQAELAQTYFQLRALDVQIGLYESTIATFAKAVQLTRSQFQGGMVTAADVAQAETQLASAEAQLADLNRQRAGLETGIAILTGRMPSSFTLERGPLVATVPAIPTGLPSALLERRPDIAAAERRVAVANEGIGAARAGWLPSIFLGADASKTGAALFSAPITVWSLGPSAAINLLNGGKTIAKTDAAWANFEAAAAQYRQTVLQSFKEVEDNLAALRHLGVQAEAQERAVRASQMALRLSLSQYQGGLTTYLQVVNTQTAALTNERSAIQVQGQRLVAAVMLVKALGGGWDTAAIGEIMQGKGPQEGVEARRW